MSKNYDAFQRPGFFCWAICIYCPKVVRMKIPKSLQQVWEWRERAARKTEKMSAEEERKSIHEVAEKYRKRCGLKVADNRAVHA